MSTDTPTTTDDQVDAQQVAMRANAVIDGLRWSLANELGDSGFEERDWYDTFGWPKRGNNGDWDADNYYALYLRNAYAYAVVAQKPKTTWKHAPDVRDRADQEEDAQRDPTEFERSITKLDRKHDLWHYCHRVDRMAGVGRHGLLVIDYDDTSEPDDFEDEFNASNTSATGLDLINGYRVYPEPMIEDIEWGEPGSDRWGKPVEYQIDLGDDADAGSQDEENTVLRVHHSRVVDVPARVLDDDETRARPRQEPCLNNILDLEKALGSTAELSYRAADYGINVNLDPEKVDTSGDALETMKDDLQSWYNGLQPFFRTTGADVNRLGGEVKDPTGIVDNNVRAIATQTGIPQRVLEGASLGELASAEKDERQYLSMIAERQQQYAEPYIARAIINHHVDDGVLPDPAGNWFDFDWPDLTEQSEQEEADVQQTRSTTVKNLQMVVPDLRGERAETYVEDGEFPERDDGEAMQQPDTVDESNPAVQETFQQASGNAGIGADVVTANATVTMDPDIPERFIEEFGEDAFVPPQDGQEKAQRILDLRADEEKTVNGGTDTGWRRAEQLAAGGLVPPKEVIQIDAWFSRHPKSEADHPDDVKPWEDNGWTARMLWGWDAVEQWAADLADQLREFMDETANALVGNEALYDEGDEVRTPDGVGVVTAVATEDITGEDLEDTIEASEDSPTYMVVVEDGRVGTGFYKADELEEGTIETDMDSPEQALADDQTGNALLDVVFNVLTSNSDFSPPPSWRKSETPARVIALKAFSGMGGSFDGCVREMRGSVSSPDRFCGSFLDYVIGNPYWRGDSPLPGE